MAENPPASLSAGERVDAFEVVRLLGRGGNGEVYLARDLVLGRKVALKVLTAESFETPGEVEAFLKEARSTAKLSHPNVVAIYAAGQHRARPYLALEFLDGPTLRQRLRRDPPSARESLRIGLAIAEALAEAHKSGILHRDLKPENVMLPSDGRLRLLDFGLARPIDTLEREPDPKDVAGTPHYMSPEQWMNRPLGPKTDVWALGVILFELLTGERPFEAGSVSALAYDVVSVASTRPLPQKPGVPEEIANVVDRMLKKDPKERPSAEECVRALSAAVYPGRFLSDEIAERGPFCGLRPFTEKEADLFFGREAEIVSFLARFQDDPMLAIVGPSGAGKSSFVRAGLIPRLEENGRWSIIRLRPGAHPFFALAQRLLYGPSSRDFRAVGDPYGGSTDPNVLAVQLAEAPERLALELRRIAHREASSVLLFVDQLEELHALCPDAETRRRFMRAISTAADDASDPVRVIVTLRDDFLGRLAEVKEARSAMSRVVVLRAPSGENLREVVERPVALAQYAFDDPSILSRIVEAVEGEPASLPLVQFACEALWERRDPKRRLLLRSAYDAIGGVEGALARHGDGLLDRMGHGELQAARQILVRMVTPERTRRTISRAAAVERLDPIAPSVLDRLIEGRVVTVRRGRPSESEEAEVELAHESLTHTWTRLARWIDESQEEIAVLFELTQAAELWEKRGRREDELWSKETLRDALAKVSRLSTRPPEAVGRFLENAERRERRRLRRRRLTVLVSFLVLLGASIFFYREKESARRANAVAQRESAQAAFDKGDLWEARAKLRGALEIEDSLEARALWVRLDAEPLLYKGPYTGNGDLAFLADGTIVIQADEAIYALDPNNFEARILRPALDNASFALSPSGRWLALGGASGAIDLVDLTTNTQKKLTGHTSMIWRLAFSPDEKRLASASFDATARIWSIEQGAIESTLEHEARVYAVSFSSDGKSLLTAGWDKAIHVWSVASGKELRTLRGHSAYVDDVQFGEGDRQIYSLARDNRVGIWDAGTGERKAMRVEFASQTGTLGSNAPKGTMLVVDTGIWWTPRGLLRWLRASDLGEIRELEAATRLSHAAFSPKRDRIVASGEGLYVYRIDRRGWRTWSPRAESARSVAVFTPDKRQVIENRQEDVLFRDVKTRDVLQRLRMPGIVSAGALSRDGAVLAVGTGDGTLRLFDTSTLSPLAAFSFLDRPVVASFAADDRSVWAADNRGDIQLWDKALGHVTRSLHAKEPVWQLLPDPKGSSLLSLTLGGKVQLWNAEGEATAVRDEAAVGGIQRCPKGRCILVARRSDDRLEEVESESGASSGEIRLGEKTGPVVTCFLPVGSGWVAYAAESGTHIVHLETMEDRPIERAPEATCHGSADGRLLETRDGTDSVVQLHAIPSGRRLWRTTALFSTQSGVELLTHKGWHKLDRDGEHPLEPPPSKWRRALEKDGEWAEASEDRGTLCVLTSSSAVELWDTAKDERRSRTATEPLDGLAALPDGCITLSGGDVRLHVESGPSRSLAYDGAAIARDKDTVLVATKDAILLVDRQGAVNKIGAAPFGTTAIASVAGDRVLGLSNGRITMLKTGWTIESRSGRPVTLLAGGPSGTIAVGHEDGTIAVLDPLSGKVLLAQRLEGAIVHLLVEGDVLYAAADTGDHTTIDLAPLSAEYCALMNEVWAGSPSAWEHGQAVPRPRPKGHGCAR